MLAKHALSAAIVVAVLASVFGCEAGPDDASPDASGDVVEEVVEEVAEPVVVERTSMIPPDAVKMTPESDPLPPLIHSDEYEAPVPMPGPINTAGAEDSGFVMPDGRTFYVWFTPDPGASLQDQLEDGVTGIYVSRKVGDEWQEPERVPLQDSDKQSLDGCEFIQGDIMWFCTARTGYTGVHWFTADLKEGRWTNWQNADFEPDLEVGELHFTADGSELYFHSPREGGKGEYDIWVSRNVDGEWLAPENVEVVNGPKIDGWPSLTQDGNELWFTSFYLGYPAILRSKRVDGEWQEPELIISQFAGESSIDNEGNVYFTHHFYWDGVMLEADIYVAMKKK
jgi:hypothetical protein